MRTHFPALAIFCLVAAPLHAKMQARPAHSPKGAHHFQDPRDSTSYPVVKIGIQTWMASNLNHATPGSWCYGQSESMCERFGRLYTWEAARHACPPGWHLPTDQEWTSMESWISDTASAEWGKKLKATSWDGTDDVDFRALPGGFRLFNGNFVQLGKLTLFWTATETSAANAWYRFLGTAIATRIRTTDRKENALSVRCIQD